MTALVGGDLSRMSAARKSMRGTRAELETLGSKANGVAVPGHPTELRGRIREVLSDTNRTAQHAQQELHRLELDLQRRAALLVLADAIGALSALFAAPKLGSGKHVQGGFMPSFGLDDELAGAIFGGIGETISKYSKELRRVEVPITRIEHDVVQMFRRRTFGGVSVTVWYTREIPRIVDDIDVQYHAMRFARAAKWTGRVFKVVDFADNLWAIKNSFGVKGPAKWTAVGGATGRMAGGAGGATGGASIGAGIGTFFCPGVGTVLGAGAGAIVGGFLGSEAGKWVGSKAGEAARQGKEALGNAAKKAGESASKAADHAKHALGSAKDTLGKLF